MVLITLCFPSKLSTKTLAPEFGTGNHYIVALFSITCHRQGLYNQPLLPHQSSSSFHLYKLFISPLLFQKALSMARRPKGLVSLLEIGSKAGLPSGPAREHDAHAPLLGARGAAGGLAGAASAQEPGLGQVPAHLVSLPRSCRSLEAHWQAMPLCSPGNDQIIYSLSGTGAKTLFSLHLLPPKHNTDGLGLYQK